MSGRADSDPVEALSIARRNASADDVIVVTGSTFIVAELREWWMEHVAAERICALRSIAAHCALRGRRCAGASARTSWASST